MNDTTSDNKPSMAQRLATKIAKPMQPDVAEFAPGLLAITQSPMPKLPRVI